MAVEIIKQEKNMIEVDFGEVDHSIPHLMVERLNDNDDVDFVAYKVEHPIIGSPHLILRTKKGDALKLFTDTLEAIKTDVDTFKKQFAEITK
ncbi:MAG: RpoL/Rpb11 RNA polymerase subunit family protein [Candidatus Micrarchaeota archaeon]